MADTTRSAGSVVHGSTDPEPNFAQVPARYHAALERHGYKAKRVGGNFTEFDRGPHTVSVIHPEATGGKNKWAHYAGGNLVGTGEGDDVLHQHLSKFHGSPKDPYAQGATVAQSIHTLNTGKGPPKPAKDRAYPPMTDTDESSQHAEEAAAYHGEGKTQKEREAIAKQQAKYDKTVPSASHLENQKKQAERDAAYKAKAGADFKESLTDYSKDYDRVLAQHGYKPAASRSLRLPNPEIEYPEGSELRKAHEETKERARAHMITLHGPGYKPDSGEYEHSKNPNLRITPGDTWHHYDLGSVAEGRMAELGSSGHHSGSGPDALETHLHRLHGQPQSGHYGHILTNPVNAKDVIPILKAHGATLHQSPAGSFHIPKDKLADFHKAAEAADLQHGHHYFIHGGKEGKGIPVTNYPEDTQHAEPVHIGDGYHFHRRGMDENGNHSIWVSKGANRAKKIQTNGNLPKYHKSKQLDNDTIAEILAYLKSSETQYSEAEAASRHISADRANEILAEQSSRLKPVQFAEASPASRASDKAIGASAVAYVGQVAPTSVPMRPGTLLDDLYEGRGPYGGGVDNGEWPEQFSETKHREPADEHLATELHLRDLHNVRKLEPDDYAKAGAEQRGEHSLHQHREAIRSNLGKKFGKGIYEHEKAKKLWSYYAKALSDTYGLGANPATRDHLAGLLADHYHPQTSDEAATGFYNKK